MKRAAGFTLLELLIGLTLLGFILALLFGGFRLATQSRDAVEKHAQGSSNEYLSLAFVRRVLGTPQPLRLMHNPGQPLAFSGQSDRLLLVAPLTEQAGLRTIELTIESGPNAQRLMLRDGSPPYGAASLIEPVIDADSRLLIDGLDEASFRFFGPLRPGEAARWHDAWQHLEKLPSLISLKLSRKDGRSMELLAATVIDASPATRVRIVIGGSQ